VASSFPLFNNLMRRRRGINHPARGYETTDNTRTKNARIFDGHHPSHDLLNSTNIGKIQEIAKKERQFVALW